MLAICFILFLSIGLILFSIYIYIYICLVEMDQVPLKKKKAEWSDKIIEVFLKVCVEEVHTGNRPQPL